MGNIDDAVPFFGRSFNRIYPLIMVVYTLLVAGNFFGYLFDFFGSWKRFKLWTEQEDDMDGFDPSEVIILQNEYARGGHVSTSGDVYSFGILLLEMITGKRPTDPIFKDGLEIINFVDTNFPHQCKDFSQARDVAENVVHQCLVSLLELALSCTRPLPSERPNMKQIASKMHAINTSYDAWKSKK